MKINITKAESSDMDFLLKLENESFPRFQQNSKSSLKHALKSSFQEVLICNISDGEITPVGSIVLYKYKHSLRIYSIALLRKYQNIGIGDYLMKHIKGYAVQNSPHDGLQNSDSLITLFLPPSLFTLANEMEPPNAVSAIL